MVETPKYYNNGQLGAKFRIGMCQTTIPWLCYFNRRY
nr:MAG TPA: hypothetical protein [Caudoviricetes sp.]